MINEFVGGNDFHTFEVELQGPESRVVIDGFELKGVRDVTVHQPLDEMPVITIEFVANKIVGMKEK